MKEYSGNFRVMAGNEMTHSMIGARYFEDGRPSEGIIFDLNTVSQLKIYNSNQVVLLPKDWQSWSQQNLPPTGLLCVHTEDYPLGEADNVLAEAERLRGKVLAEMRGGGSEVVEEVAPDATPSTAPLPTEQPAQSFHPFDKNKDGVVDKQEMKQGRKGK
jgi:hypothetical protein